MSEKKHTNVYDEKIRRAEDRALNSDSPTYKAPNGTVPRTPPAKTKSLGEVVGEVKALFSGPKKKK